MADENGAQAPTPDGAQKQAVTLPKMQVLGQFIRDLSFENVAAQKSVPQSDGKPNIQVRVSLDAKKREDGENRYEVVIKLNIDSKTAGGDTIFLMELDYGGLFSIDNVQDNQLHPFLMIECPRMLFPFLRRVVSDVTRDGGYPPLNLETIDWVNLYRNEIARRASQQANPAPTGPSGTA